VIPALEIDPIANTRRTPPTRESTTERPTLAEDITHNPARLRNIQSGYNCRPHFNYFVDVSRLSGG
jgi:hypothetical protein